MSDVENVFSDECLCLTQGAVVPSTEDVSISFLPLAHMFERVVQVASPVVFTHMRLVF